ncbi:proline dehydrogenase family protein, partial [Candidatus Woesearchaeota archaeon]|nr:proline dehydrogenase family protein [Candidatus Woesearchaeota archaeon]
MGIVSFLGKEYLAGHSLEEGIEFAEHLFHQGISLHGHPISSTIDILGEEAKSPENVEANLQAYQKVIKVVASSTKRLEPIFRKYQLHVPFSVSFKLSAISLSERTDDEIIFDSRVSLERNVRRLIATGVERGIPLTVDMEDHLWTYPTLKLVRRFWAEGLPLDMVLQSCLDQTLGDVKYFLNSDLPLDRSRTTIRACRGIYREPSAIATNNPREAKKRLYSLVNELLGIGYLV